MTHILTIKQHLETPPETLCHTACVFGLLSLRGHSLRDLKKPLEATTTVLLMMASVLSLYTLRCFSNTSEHTTLSSFYLDHLTL